LAWYTEYVGHANFLPWREHGASTVFIYSISSKQPPGRPGPISITVLPTTNEVSWMTLKLLDFNQLDFGEPIDDLPTSGDES
jgi:hypothetical protein